MLEKNIIDLGEQAKQGDKESLIKLYRVGEDLTVHTLNLGNEIDYDKVIELYEFIHNIDGGQISAKLLGNTYMAIGEKEKAVYWFGKFLDIIRETKEEVRLKQFIIFNYKILLSELLEKEIELVEKTGFGYEKEKAIDVFQVIGEEYYLNSLISLEGQVVFWKRVGNVGSDADNHTIDQYEIYIITHKPDYKLKKFMLYLDMYNRTIKKQVPDGFVLNKG